MTPSGTSSFCRSIPLSTVVTGKFVSNSAKSDTDLLIFSLVGWETDNFLWSGVPVNKNDNTSRRQRRTRPIVNARKIHRSARPGVDEDV